MEVMCGCLLYTSKTLFHALKTLSLLLANILFLTNIPDAHNCITV